MFLHKYLFGGIFQQNKSCVLFDCNFFLLCQCLSIIICTCSQKIFVLEECWSMLKFTNNTLVSHRVCSFWTENVVFAGGMTSAVNSGGGSHDSPVMMQQVKLYHHRSGSKENGKYPDRF